MFTSTSSRKRTNSFQKVKLPITHFRFRNTALLVVTLALMLTALIRGCKPDTEPDLDFVRSFANAPSKMKNWKQDDPKTRALLSQYKPHIYLASGSYLPVNFYQDYLPDCVVKSRAKNRVIYNQIDRQKLTQIQNDLDHYLDYQTSSSEVLTSTLSDITPTLYGRVYSDTLVTKKSKVSLIFLKYSLVFPYSGLPAKLTTFKSIGSRIIGNPRAWHELDIHGAIHIVLDGKTEEPIGVLLAQHNHHRFYMAGRDFEWPADKRIGIAISEFSNEPYLIENDKPLRYERTIGFPTDLEYLFGRTSNAPLGSGLDRVVNPSGNASEIELQLVLLSLDDPLYTAWINLGDRRKVLRFFDAWYMNGPPGIDFYTFPELKDLADLAAFSYINSDDDYFFELLETNFKSFSDYDLKPILAYQKERFLQKIVE